MQTKINIFWLVFGIWKYIYISVFVFEKKDINFILFDSNYIILALFIIKELKYYRVSISYSMSLNYRKPKYKFRFQYQRYWFNINDKLILTIWYCLLKPIIKIHFCIFWWFSKNNSYLIHFQVVQVWNSIKYVHRNCIIIIILYLNDRFYNLCFFFFTTLNKIHMATH